jgi:hypothetical protein
MQSASQIFPHDQGDSRVAIRRGGGGGAGCLTLRPGLDGGGGGSSSAERALSKGKTPTGGEDREDYCTVRYSISSTGLVLYSRELTRFTSET